MSKLTKKRSSKKYANKNARIEFTGNPNAFRAGVTTTARRDDLFQLEIRTDSSGRSVLELADDRGTFRFDGRKARTLYRLLAKHYDELA